MAGIRFAIVNMACPVLRRDPDADEGFKAPMWTPYVGVLACLFLVGPRARDPADYIQFKIAGAMIAIGVALWALTWMTNCGIRGKRPDSATSPPGRVIPRERPPRGVTPGAP